MDKTPDTIPEVDPQQGLKDKKAMLEQKLKDLEKLPKPDHPSFNHDAALQRAQAQLTEVNKAIKKEGK